MPAAKNRTLQLTPRDLQIILMVYHYDGLVNKHLRRRFWGSFGPSRHCYRRVQQLINHGYLKALHLPSESFFGSGPCWLTIGPASTPVLREYLGLAQADIRRLRHSVL